MKTDQKASDLINQAITNLSGEREGHELRAKLWECMKLAAILEIKESINSKRPQPEEEIGGYFTVNNYFTK